MNKLIKIKNTSIDDTWTGQLILTDEYYTLENNEINAWINDTKVFDDIANGILIVNTGIDITDDLSPLDGWKWLSLSDVLPISDLDGIKVAVHSSSKPVINNSNIYVVWSSSGDDPDTGMICGGQILDFGLIPGVSEQIIDVKFDQMMNGRVWISEGYLKFNNGGPGDYMNAEVISSATPLQTSINLDLIVDVNGFIMYSTGGPGTGTHGFADASKITLIPCSYSKNGGWDYDGVNLIPNMSNIGAYKLSMNEEIVHRYINKISCRGSCSSYFSLSSNETSEILHNYFLRISAYNISNTTWNSSVIMELYRERTYNP